MPESESENLPPGYLQELMKADATYLERVSDINAIHRECLADVENDRLNRLRAAAASFEDRVLYLNNKYKVEPKLDEAEDDIDAALGDWVKPSERGV